MDAGTGRIVRYLVEKSVPIKIATVQHFEDANGRELLAQVFLIEPEAVQPMARRTSARSGYRTVNGLQDLADEKGIGELYRRLRDGVRGIFFAQGYAETVAYVRRLESGAVRTVMLVIGVMCPHSEYSKSFRTSARLTSMRDFRGHTLKVISRWRGPRTPPLPGGGKTMPSLGTSLSLGFFNTSSSIFEAMTAS